MAIVDAFEIAVRNGEVELGNILRRKYERTFQVLTSGHTIGMLEVMVALGVNYGDTYSEDDGAVVRRVTATQPSREHPKQWHCTVYYDTETTDPESASVAAGGGGGGGAGAPQDTNPVNQPPTIVWGSRTETRPLRKDVSDGRPIANTAGSLFELQSIEKKITTLRITRNQASYDPFDMDDYKNKLNSAAFQGRPDSTVLCRDITAASAFSNNILYYTVSYDFDFAPFAEPDYWKLVLVDKGPKYLDGVTLLPISYKTADGIPQEVFLDGVGGEKNLAFNLSTGLMDDGFEPAEVSFNTYDTIDFGVLALPDPAY